MGINIENLTSSDFEQRVVKPKILLWDLETSPAIVAAWGAYESNALWVKEYPRVITFSVKYLHGKQVTKCLADYPDHSPENDDKALIEELYGYLETADFVIAQNGDSFDMKVAKARFLKHKLPPLPPILSVDTKKIAKREFRLFSNKLDWMGDFLGNGRKQEHEGIGLWRKCVEANDRKAWDRMKKYCARDVRLLETTYLAMRGWDRLHPNMNVIFNREEGCAKCGSTNIHHRGYRYTPTGRQRRFQCQDCKGYSTGKHVKTSTVR